MINKLTDEQVIMLQLRIMSALSFYCQRPEKAAKKMTELLTLCGAAASELQEHRKFDQAKLINKFYERYPLETFKSDSERAEALGYYMAGAELQRCGEFIVYEDANCDE